MDNGQNIIKLNITPDNIDATIECGSDCKAVKITRYKDAHMDEIIATISNEEISPTSIDETLAGPPISRADVIDFFIARLAPNEIGFDVKTFSAYLRQMKDHFRSVNAFAKESGVSLSFISKAMNGFITHRPSKRTVALLLTSEAINSIDDESGLAKAAGYTLQY